MGLHTTIDNLPRHNVSSELTFNPNNLPTFSDLLCTPGQVAHNSERLHLIKVTYYYIT